MRSLTARRNAAARSVPASLATVAVIGGIGAGIGAFAHPKDVTTGFGAVGGAGAGLTFGTLGGLITAMVSEKYREAGLVTAGLSLAGLVILSVGSSVYTNATASDGSSSPPPQVTSTTPSSAVPSASAAAA